ncbi:MAG: phage tail tape measure protein, partial [Desulfurococcaceae archaeon]
AKPVQAFMDLEEAQAHLKTVLTGTGEEAQKQYEAMLKLAQRLGTDLPGSTKDMIEMFIALREQGVSVEKILGGIGEAAAKFAVVMKLPFSEAATAVAKLQEALGVAESQMEEFMDFVQRIKTASGVEMSDLLYTFRYLGPTLKTLELQGLESAKSIGTVVAMLASAGIEGSMAGTNLAAALSRLTEIDKRLEKSKELQEFIPLLKEAGIHLQFFEKGKFLGLEHMIAQLEKLKVLAPEDRLKLLKKLFGEEGARPMAMLIEMGLEGYKQMLKRIEQQKSMQEKIDIIMASTKMKLDTLKGTWDNFVAAIGMAISKGAQLGAIFDLLNSIVERMTNFVMAHKTLAGVIGGGLLAVSTALMMFGALGIAVSVFGRALVYTMRGWQVFQAGLVRSIALSRVFIASLIRIPLLLRTISLAFLTTPIGWIGLVLGVVALVIRKYWEPLVNFFKGFWEGIKAALKGLEPAWDSLKKVLKVIVIMTPALWPLYGVFKLLAWGISKVYGWLKDLLKPVQDGEKAFKNLGFAVGQAIAKILIAILTFPAKVVDTFYEAGKKIIDSLVKGMLAVANKPVEAIRSVLTKIRNMLPFSPAKEGPLATLHKVRIVETLAETVNPQPLLGSFTKALESLQKVGVTKAQGIAKSFAQVLSVSGLAPLSLTKALESLQKVGMTKAQGVNLQALRLASASTPAVHVTISGITQNLSLNSVLQSPQEVASVVAIQTKETIIKAIDEYFRRKKAHRAVWGGD